MNLIKFLFIVTFLSVILGELGRFPFGGSSASVTITDCLLFLTLIFFLIWKISTKEKIFHPKYFKWLVYFWGVALVSLLISKSWLPVTEILKGGMYLVRFVLYSSSLLIVFNLVQQKIITQETIIKWLVLTGVSLTLLGFTQLLVYPNFEDPPFYLTDYGFDPHRGRLTSTLLDPNFFGVFLLINLGLTIYLIVKHPGIKSWFPLSLILGGLILTMSRSAYLGLFVLLLLLMLLGRKFIQTKWLTLITILTVVIITTIPQFQTRLIGAFLIDESASLRFESWWKGKEIVQLNPFTGVGFNNIRAVQQDLNLVQTTSIEGGHSGAGVDSSLLFVLATTGTVGLIIYLTFWFQAFKSLWQQASALSTVVLSILAALLISSQFINSLFFPGLMLWYFSLLGLVQDPSG